jgi:cytochrome c peroxidase
LKTPAAERAAKPLAPLPAKVATPEDNPSTPEKIALGKQLFFDPRLSGGNNVSCATCHLAQRAFGDGMPRATGRDGKTLARNTPSLLNVAFAASFHWDGRVKSLEEQALLPVQAPDEMRQDLDELERELNAVSGYVEQFEKIFGAKPTRGSVAKALAAFERTLVSGPAPLDRYLAGEKDALSAAAKRGMELFVGDAGCATCHHGPRLTDEKFYRLGVSFQDQGRAVVSGERRDKAKFRTPSLRNVAQTGPYMHDGSLRTLEEVVTFYYRGVPTTTPDELPLDVAPLVGQSFTEIPDLVAFLEALSGELPQIEPPKLP